MTEYLVLSAVGKDRPGIVSELSAAISEHSCNIDDSRMAILGGEFAIILMLSGAPASIEALKQALPTLEESIGLTILTRTTEARSAPTGERPYAIEVITMDQPGIVHLVTSFFSERQINIDSLETETYPAPHTGTPMFALSMAVFIPNHEDTDELTADFEAFCESQDLDGHLDAIK